jgi:NTE family protein
LSDGRDIALVLSGGIGLGAYQAGAYEALHLIDRFDVVWIAGSSIGAVHAALLAGTDDTARLDVLRAFWSSGVLAQPFFPAIYSAHAQNWLSVLQTRLFGATNIFKPRMWRGPFAPFRSLYDLDPLKRQLERLVDFERVNGGDVRVSVAATDIETGELVIFDTAAGHRIELDHVLASCGFLPEFAPVEIEGRLLGDGGLSANAPVEALLTGDGTKPISNTFVIDLFAADGRRPESFEDALARKNDLLFGNQTIRRLEAYVGTGRLGRVTYLSYRPSDDEAGPEKTFDFSRRTIARRWASGVADMRRAVELTADSSAKRALTMVRN